MALNNVILAIEDRLSDVVATKILNHFGGEIIQKAGYKGNSYLQQKAQSFNKGARKECSIFMLTDLDSPQDCPPGLIQSWIRGPLNPYFLIRVAVMEVESWVMADRVGFANFLSIPIHRIPSPTVDILNPKEFLVSLARKSQKKRVRQALVPGPGTNLSVGPQYNEYLSDFIQDHWNLERAATVSPSLKRTIDRLTQEMVTNEQEIPTQH